MKESCSRKSTAAGKKPGDNEQDESISIHLNELTNLKNWQVLQSTDFVDIISLVIFSDGSVQGYIAARFSSIMIKKRAQDVATRELLVALVCLVLGGILAVLLANHVSRRIHIILDGCQKVSEGNLRHSSPGNLQR